MGAQMTNKQSGFGLIETLLLVVIVVVIGLIAWRGIIIEHEADNQLDQTAGQQSTVIPSNEDAASSQQNTAVTDKRTGYVVISDWGIRFKPVNGLSDVRSYKVTSSEWLNSVKAIGFQGYDLTTKKIEDLGGICSRKNSSEFGLVRISRTSKEVEEWPWGGRAVVSAHIGGYFYYLDAAPSTCSDDSKNDQIQIDSRQKMLDSLKSLEAVK
jgi:hypothetical protein